MTAARVVLVTVAGPGGQVDIGVRSDATAAQLASSLGSVIGVSVAVPVAELRSPPRPGVPAGRRSLLRAGSSLAQAGVADGDLILFKAADDIPPGAVPPQARSSGQMTGYEEPDDGD